MSRLGQFGYVARRYVSSEEYVRSVEQRTVHVGGAAQMWKYITLFVGAPLMSLSFVNSVILGEHRERPEFIHYPYLKRLVKPFPWGDGKHTLFHSPKRNYVPGIGYEE